jgi:hypothetical protein
LREYTKDVKLNAGDMIIDSVTGQIGLLIAYDRRISITSDDVYFWSVKWSNDAHSENSIDIINLIWMEEEGLKLSILVGFYNLHSH